MFGWLKKEDNAIKEGKIIKDADKYSIYMSELQNKIDDKEITFGEAVELLKKATPKYRDIYDNSGRVINITAVGDRWAEPYVSAIVMTNDKFIRSAVIEGFQIEDFDIENDDMSNIIGRKISWFRVNDDDLIYIHNIQA